MYAGLRHNGQVTETRIETVLTQAQFDEYARLSGDDNPIHVDPGFAASTRFGRTVAHGMFLFGLLQAAHARHRPGSGPLVEQNLMFRAPTFAGDPVTLTIKPTGSDRFAETITAGRGAVTVSGDSRFGAPAAVPPEPPAPERSFPYHGLEVGMSAGRTRVFTAADVAAYVALLDAADPRLVGPEPEVPPALLGGMVSCILGVDLPGRGTNWLKQHYSFHRRVTAPVEVTTTVTITRIRAEKGLVNLESSTSDAGGVLVSGESLVLAVDTEPR
jgi:acyl dehydratase